MKTKKTVKKALGGLMLLLTFGATSLSKAQSSELKVITDIETSTSYYTIVTEESDGSVVFAMNPSEVVATPNILESDRWVVGGPRHEFSSEIEVNGTTVYITFRICSNSIFWPCAWCANTF